jgi:hypothetical protein
MSNYSHKSSSVEADSMDNRSEEDYEEPFDEGFLRWEEEENKKEEKKAMIDFSDHGEPSSSIGQGQAFMSQKLGVYVNGQFISMADWIKFEKAKLWEEALAETLKLYPHMATSWKYMAPEIVKEMVRMATGVTYDCK